MAASPQQMANQPVKQGYVIIIATIGLRDMTHMVQRAKVGLSKSSLEHSFLGAKVHGAQFSYSESSGNAR